MNNRAHPPIHPVKGAHDYSFLLLLFLVCSSILHFFCCSAYPPTVKAAPPGTLHGREEQLYNFIARRFLACCSRDAEGQKTSVEATMGGERFSASGLMVLARNYLDVYPWDKWHGSKIPVFVEGETFEPTSLKMTSSSTQAPRPITESELIAKMDSEGIGTDATIAAHIETVVKVRCLISVVCSLLRLFAHLLFVPSLVLSLLDVVT